MMILHSLGSPLFPYTTLFRSVVRWFLFFGNCIAHPSVMMRRDLLDRLGYYRAEALHVEDYELWIRAAEVTALDRKSTRLNSSHLGISYAVFSSKKKNTNITST